MEHRQPRLGDILDDYCPRERRITNHAVVAMVGPEIKQTRCTTCDAEHEYKHAKVPSARKKKEAPAALYKQVLASAQPESAHADEQPPASGDAPTAPPAAATAPPEPQPVVEQAPGTAADEAAMQAQQEADEAGDNDGPVHRRLIRATLPRPEGPTQRPLPQFTVRQPGKFNNANARGGRPQTTGSMTRPRTSPSRGAFGRNTNSRGDNTFTARPSGGSHHPLQRSRPSHRPAGRPVRHGKKSPK
jgi:hypothetical protein